MKRVLSAVLAVILMLSLIPAGYAADGSGINRESLFLRRSGAKLGSVLYIDDPERGTVAFLSPEHAKQDPKLAETVEGLKDVVQIVHSENCDFDFDAAFLFRDGTVACTDRCGHYSHLRNVVKLSACASYALLRDGTVVLSADGKAVLQNAVDMDGTYMNCFAVTDKGRVVPIRSDLSRKELDEIGSWENISNIIVNGRDVFGYSSDGKLRMTGETKERLDGKKEKKDYDVFFDDGEGGIFTPEEIKRIDEYFVDITNDGYDDHVVVIPFDQFSEYEEISEVTQLTKSFSYSRKIMVFSGTDGCLIYTDTVNTTRQNSCEEYIRNDSGMWFFLKHYYDEQTPGWTEALEVYSLTNLGKEAHNDSCETSTSGKTGEKSIDQDILRTLLDIMKETGFLIAESKW